MTGNAADFIKCIAVALLALAFAAPGAGAEEKKEARVRDNKVAFGSFHTAQDLAVFLVSHPGYQKSDETGWIKFNENKFDYGRIWAPEPSSLPVSTRTVSHIKVVLVTSPGNECATAPRLLFLKAPETASGASIFRLFAYEYNICDNTNMLNPDDMLKQYIAKYGMYDKKDYDRNMIIYNNVTGGYRLGARTFEGEGEKRGLTITVVDDEVFSDIYRLWRGVLRLADNKIRSSF